MEKKVAAIQSNYIPWKGYFDIINMADEFVIYDDVNYTKNDWRNRNKIKTHQGIIWLTIPVRFVNIGQKIKETKIMNNLWQKKHWNSLTQNYSKAAYFAEYKDFFEDLYLNHSEEYLSQINYRFITAINKLLGITTKITWLSDYSTTDGKNERLISLLKQTNATEYISGPSARDYLDVAAFEKENIKVIWMDYNYPEYNQIYPPFTHAVSIVDLIFNEGPNAIKYMKTF